MGEENGKISIKRPGMHKVCNLLAAIAVGLELDIDFSTISKA